MLPKELVAASTEPLILTLLSGGKSYGYELIQEVKRLSDEKIEWTDGMLYPVLHRMERKGWIQSRWRERPTTEILFHPARRGQSVESATRAVADRIRHL